MLACAWMAHPPTTQAKEAAPSIVFVDEIDAVGRSRGTGIGGGSDEREQARRISVRRRSGDPDIRRS